MYTERRQRRAQTLTETERGGEVGLETLKATRHEPLRSYLSDVLPRSRLVKVNRLHELISRQTTKRPWLATPGGTKGFSLSYLVAQPRGPQG